MQVNVNQIMEQLAALEKATNSSTTVGVKENPQIADKGSNPEPNKKDSSDILQEAISKSGLEGKQDVDLPVSKYWNRLPRSHPHIMRSGWVGFLVQTPVRYHDRGSMTKGKNENLDFFMTFCAWPPSSFLTSYNASKVLCCYFKPWPPEMSWVPTKALYLVWLLKQLILVWIFS